MQGEITNIPNIRWHRETDKHPPVLQYLVSGTGIKDGEYYPINRWENVPLFIGDNK